ERGRPGGVGEGRWAGRAARPGRGAGRPRAVGGAAGPAGFGWGGGPATAIPASAAARMAAVAESAATTRCRDEPRTAKTAIGSSNVYRPVTSGIPAILA